MPLFPLTPAISFLQHQLIQFHRHMLRANDDPTHRTRSRSQDHQSPTTSADNPLFFRHLHTTPHSHLPPHDASPRASRLSTPTSMDSLHLRPFRHPPGSCSSDARQLERCPFSQHLMIERSHLTPLSPSSSSMFAAADKKDTQHFTRLSYPLPKFSFACRCTSCSHYLCKGGRPLPRS